MSIERDREDKGEGSRLYDRRLRDDWEEIEAICRHAATSITALLRAHGVDELPGKEIDQIKTLADEFIDVARNASDWEWVEENNAACER